MLTARTQSSTPTPLSPPQSSDSFDRSCPSRLDQEERKLQSTSFQSSGSAIPANSMERSRSIGLSPCPTMK